MYEVLFLGQLQRKTWNPFLSRQYACVANEILKWIGCVRPGGAVLGIVGGGVTFRFLNGEAILDKNMLFWVRLYALVVVLKILLDFRL